MTQINSRYALETNGEASFRVVDLYRQTVVGDFWSTQGCWAFQLEDGRSRFGGYTKVFASLKRMLAKVGA